MFYSQNLYGRNWEVKRSVPGCPKAHALYFKARCFSSDWLSASFIPQGEFQHGIPCFSLSCWPTPSTNEQQHFSGKGFAAGEHHPLAPSSFHSPLGPGSPLNSELFYRLVSASGPLPLQIRLCYSKCFSSLFQIPGRLPQDRLGFKVLPCHPVMILMVGVAHGCSGCFWSVNPGTQVWSDKTCCTIHSAAQNDKLPQYQCILLILSGLTLIWIGVDNVSTIKELKNDLLCKESHMICIFPIGSQEIFYVLAQHSCK